MQGSALNVAELALEPLLLAGAARTGELAVEAFDAGPVNRVSLAPLDMVDAATFPLRKGATRLTPADHQRPDALAPRSGAPPRHQGGMPSREMGLSSRLAQIFAKIFANGHPQTTSH